MLRAFFFYGMSRKRFELLHLYNDVQCSVDDEISAQSILDKSGTKSPTPEGCRAWLAWAGNVGSYLF